VVKSGVVYRLSLVPWINSRQGRLDAVEIVAEEFRSASEKLLRELGDSFLLTVRTAQLSIGTPGPMRESTLHEVSSIVAQASPSFITAALGFSRSEETDLGIPIPVCMDLECLNVVADHALELVEKWRTPLLFENITSDLRVKGRIAEPDFIGRLCEATGSGILLDVTSLLVNGRNHGFDPKQWVREIDARRIVQLHVAGYSFRNGRWHDDHLENVQQDVWDLTREILSYATPAVITLERYGNFPSATELDNEMNTLMSAAAAGSA
jgi:uncharacterized protein